MLCISVYITNCFQFPFCSKEIPSPSPDFLQAQAIFLLGGVSQYGPLLSLILKFKIPPTLSKEWSSHNQVSNITYVKWGHPREILQPTATTRPKQRPKAYGSPGLFALQLTIFTFSAWSWFWLSSLKVTSLMRKVQTSSQKRYVSKWPFDSNNQISTINLHVSPDGWLPWNSNALWPYLPVLRWYTCQSWEWLSWRAVARCGLRGRVHRVCRLEQAQGYEGQGS